MNVILISKIVQIIVAVLLMILVLLQSKGTGLFSAFSGSFSFYGARRGLEKVIFISTIVLGIIFSLNSLLLILLS